MATSLITKLDTAFTGSAAATLPRLIETDAIESSGSLLLIEPGHPAARVDGVPIDGQVIPNLVEKQSLALLGTTDVSAVRPVMKRPSAFTGSVGLLERTSKGGLHGIMPQGGTGLKNTGPVVTFANGIMKYILDHPRNNYYVSFWGRITRQGPTASQGILSINGNGQQTNSFLAGYIAPIAGNPTHQARPHLGTNPNKRLSPDAAGLGNVFYGAQANGWVSSTVAGSLPGDGTNASVTGAQAGGGVGFGSPVPWNGIGVTGIATQTGVFSASASTQLSDTARDGLASFVFYRTYLEDLTASGRTYAEVDAIEFAEYQKAFGAGGRYADDTFTDPAMLP